MRRHILDWDVPPLPSPEQSGINHIVLVTMENRSFDHLLGWLPFADGRQAGLEYADKQGVVHPTHPLAPDYQGCDFADPDHSFSGGRIEYDDGKCDGWLRAGSNDTYSIGYYTRTDVPFLGEVATRFVTPDRYFAAMLGPTFPNRIFQHAAQTDRLGDNVLPFCTLPTIWDRLSTAGIDGRYFFSDVPITALWGTRHAQISHAISQFFSAAAAGTLPSVSFVDPGFLRERIGTSNDDHPHVDIRDGEVFLNSVYTAVTSSPNWSSTVLVINFDEWGGFFEHVPPPPGPITAPEQSLGYTDGLRGFRVPCVVISPWSQRRDAPHTVFDHTSVLNMIEWRFGLEPLSVRDAAAENLVQVLDFEHPRLDVPRPVVPPGPHGSACSST
ncbi:MAG: alkaline phosphatase family protein, partial [Mycobacterium sp.]|nr:alkaline phosphatase family protein [Mycobacterium sp.]